MTLYPPDNIWDPHNLWNGHACISAPAPRTYLNSG